jgi:hypothetical protein
VCAVAFMTQPCSVWSRVPAAYCTSQSHQPGMQLKRIADEVAEGGALGFFPEVWSTDNVASDQHVWSMVAKKIAVAFLRRGVEIKRPDGRPIRTLDELNELDEEELGALVFISQDVFHARDRVAKPLPRSHPNYNRCFSYADFKHERTTQVVLQAHAHPFCVAHVAAVACVTPPCILQQGYLAFGTSSAPLNSCNFWKGQL